MGSGLAKLQQSHSDKATLSTHVTNARILWGHPPGSPD